jgi:prepilin-type N-terminal cleavage/methylation domain-containing protein
MSTATTRINCRESGRARAFSLVELLVVMAVIAVLAGIGIPALKGLGGSNSMGAATRQLLDDLAYARLKAINDRTTVYVVFVSDQILRQPWNSQQRREIAKVANLQYTSYALFANRSLGDQPGPGTARYITDWRTLPEGTFIPTNKFNYAAEPNRMQAPIFTRTLRHVLIPFPTATNQSIPLPCIAFDFQGRLKQTDDVVLPIARGSIIYPQEQNPNSMDSPEVIESPKGGTTNNPSIRIDWLTGRARTQLPEKVDYAGN